MTAVQATSDKETSHINCIVGSGLWVGGGKICRSTNFVVVIHIIWASEFRYLGIIVAKCRFCKCSLESAKRSLSRAAKAVFGKIGRTASE